MLSLIFTFCLFGNPTFAQPKEDLKEVAFFNLKAVNFCYKKCSGIEVKNKDQNRVFTDALIPDGSCQTKCLDQGVSLLDTLKETSDQTLNTL